MYKFAMNCQFDAVTLNKIYEDAFGINKYSGWFVEVGASNGEDYSNTSCLADAGWNGLYVEPVANLAEQCRRRHRPNRVTTFTAAAGNDNGKQALWLIPHWGTATSNMNAAETICEDAMIDPVEFLSNVLKLDTIIAVGGCPKEFDLLVIDVDFGEIQVLQGFHIDYWRPKLVIIELHEESNHPLSEDVRQFAFPYFASAGYEKIYRDGINTIFRRSDGTK